MAQKAALDGEPDAQILGLEDGLGVGVGGRRRALRLGRDQVLGVGMLRRGEDVGHRAALDDLAIVHDAHPVGHLAHDAEIMGDEQHRHVELGLELRQQLEDLRLDGDVERGGGLVGDEQVGLVGKRHGDHHALTLAAGELMRIAVEPALGIVDADLIEQIEHALARGAIGKPTVDLQHLADLPLDRVQRIERGHRLLEDHRDLVAADLAERRWRKREQVLALEQDRSGWVRRRGVGEETEDRERRHRLARARTRRRVRPSRRRRCRTTHA